VGRDATEQEFESHCANTCERGGEEKEEFSLVLVYCANTCERGGEGGGGEGGGGRGGGRGGTSGESKHSSLPRATSQKYKKDEKEKEPQEKASTAFRKLPAKNSQKSVA